MCLYDSDFLPRGVSIAWGVPILRGASILRNVSIPRGVTWWWCDIVPNGGTGVDPCYGTVLALRNVHVREI